MSDVLRETTLYQVIEGDSQTERMRTSRELGGVVLPVEIGSEALDEVGAARRITPEEKAELERRISEVEQSRIASE